MAMTNIVAKAKAGTVDVEQRTAILEAMERAKIDRSETCFKGFGNLSVEDLSKLTDYVDEMCDETLW